MIARRLLGLALACTLLGATPRTPIYGFAPLASDRERALEARFVDIPSAQGAFEHAGAIGARPHDAGSPGDRELALYMRDTFRAYGLEAELESWTVRIDRVKRLSVVMIPADPAGAERPLAALAEPTQPPLKPHKIMTQIRKRQMPLPPDPTAVALDLREAPNAGDAATGDPAIGIPFTPGSGDGHFSAPLVYASRGLPQDYTALVDHAVPVRDAVLLIRYGAEPAALLARRAQERGAAAVIFYSDPAEDGFARGGVLPNGPWRPATSVRRESVGSGITIPVLPVSAANAQRLLEQLRGPAAPSPWAGALPVAYPYASGPLIVKLDVQMEHVPLTLWNTIARIRGSSSAAQTIVLGAHRDAWVFGVGDNGSGVIALLELARGLGYLGADGWRPRRTLVLAGWDGAELGQLGALAYVKRHREELNGGGIAYLDLDRIAIGPAFEARAASALAPALADVVREIPDPASGRRSVFDQWSAETRIPVPVPSVPLAGVDLDPFLLDIGAPVASMGFTGPLGAANSSYDTLRLASSIGDPGFARHRAAAQIYGMLALRLADADAIPYVFSAYAPAIRAALGSLAQRAANAKKTFDPAALVFAVQAFEDTAMKFDALSARGANPESATRAVAAVRILDLALYGSTAPAPAILPEIERALESGNAEALASAMGRAKTAIDRAAALLAGT